MMCLLSIAVHALFFVGGLLLIVYFYFQHKFKTWKKLNIPYIEPKFPFGTVSGVAFSQSFGDSLMQAYKMSPGKPFVGMFTFSSPYLSVRDPDLIKTIFVKEFMSFHDRGLYYNEKDDPLSANLLSIRGSKWKNLRTKLSPTFTSGKMKMMFPILLESSQLLIDLLKEPARKGEVIEVKEYAARFTTDVIAASAFGVQANSLKDPNAHFRVIGRKLVEPTFKNNLRATVIGFWPEVANKLRMRLNPLDITDYFMKIVHDTISYRKKNNVKGKDFMQLLIQLMDTGRIEDSDRSSGDANTKSDESGKITFEEAAAQAFIFFLGGFETSSTTMQFALYELAVNPDIQETLREEILRVLEKHDNKMSYEAVHEMEYLGRVIDETLRKYPPIAVLLRQCNKSFKIPDTDVVIPEGTRIQIPILGIQNDPQYYPNPERFDPERFTEKEKSKRHNYTYLPFGEGPRNCIGMRFGLMQTRVGLISLLSKYRFDVAESTPVPMVFDKNSFFLSPDGGMNLKITESS